MASSIDAQLLDAVERKDVAGVRSALGLSANPDVRKLVRIEVAATRGVLADVRQCESALCLAVRDGWRDGVRMLLDAGADPNVPLSWSIANVFPASGSNSDSHLRWRPDGHKYYQSALVFALLTSKSRFSPPGSRVLLREPRNWDQVREVFYVEADMEIVRSLLEHGAKVTDEALEAARKRSDPSFSRLLEEHSRKRASRRTPASLDRNGTAAARGSTPPSSPETRRSSKHAPARRRDISPDVTATSPSQQRPRRSISAAPSSATRRPLSPPSRHFSSPSRVLSSSPPSSGAKVSPARGHSFSGYGSPPPTPPQAVISAQRLHASTEIVPASPARAPQDSWTRGETARQPGPGKTAEQPESDNDDESSSDEDETSSSSGSDSSSGSYTSSDVSDSPPSHQGASIPITSNKAPITIFSSSPRGTLSPPVNFSGSPSRTADRPGPDRYHSPVSKSPATPQGGVGPQFDALERLTSRYLSLSTSRTTAEAGRAGVFGAQSGRFVGVEVQSPGGQSGRSREPWEAVERRRSTGWEGMGNGGGGDRSMSNGARPRVY